MEFVDIDTDQMSPLRREVSAGERQRPSQTHNQAAKEFPRFTSHNPAVQGHQHNFPLGEQIHERELRVGLSEDIPKPRTERELSQFVEHRLNLLPPL